MTQNKLRIIGVLIFASIIVASAVFTIEGYFTSNQNFLLIVGATGLYVLLNVLITSEANNTLRRHKVSLTVILVSAIVILLFYLMTIQLEYFYALYFGLGILVVGGLIFFAEWTAKEKLRLKQKITIHQQSYEQQTEKRNTDVKVKVFVLSVAIMIVLEVFLRYLEAERVISYQVFDNSSNIILFVAPMVVAIVAGLLLKNPPNHCDEEDYMI